MLTVGDNISFYQSQGGFASGRRRISRFVTGKIIYVDDVIFTVKHKWPESFHVRDIKDGQIRIKH